MLYAKNSRAIGQVLSDLGLIVVVIALIFVARFVNRVLRLFAVPAEDTAQATTNLAGQLSDAGDGVASVPLVGAQLQKPFQQLSAAVGNMTGSIGSLVQMVHTTALVVAIVVFVVPLVLYLWKWLPWRYTFVREASAGQRLLASPVSAELFALRAISHAPMSALAKITPDPLGAWQAGDHAVIERLANLELGLDGLRLPTPARGQGLTG